MLFMTAYMEASVTRKRTKGTGAVRRRRARFRKNDNQMQRLQWTLEQTQLRYNELQDRHDKQMDLAARLLGFCAISGFTTFLSQSSWKDIESPVGKIILKVSLALLLVVACSAALVLCTILLMSSIDDKFFQDITLQKQEQSMDERTTSLIKSLSKRIQNLRRLNFAATIALYILYVLYAASFEFLVVTIIISH